MFGGHCVHFILSRGTVMSANSLCCRPVRERHFESYYIFCWLNRREIMENIQYWFGVEIVTACVK